MGQIQVGCLILLRNNLSTLPEAFHHLTLGDKEYGKLYLCHNDFEEPYAEYEGFEIDWIGMMWENILKGEVSPNPARMSPPFMAVVCQLAPCHARAARFTRTRGDKTRSPHPCPVRGTFI